MAKQATESKEVGKSLSPEELKAKIALTGNLAGLNDEARWLYYQWYCDYLGLDPITRPFDIITTYETGPNSERVEKTILYANAGCAAQLADKRHITYGIPVDSYDPDLGTLTIKVMAQFSVADVPRSCWRRGVAHVSGLKGRTLENAIKRAETQAHRRATLALCGIAMPDESEIADIDGAEASMITPPGAHDASGDVGDLIGTYLKAAGFEDNAAERGFIIEGLRSGAYQAVANRMKVPIDVVLNLNKRRNAVLQDVRLSEAAARIEQSLDDPLKVEALKQEIAPAIEAAREKAEEARQEEKAIKAEREQAKQDQKREEETAADPVAGLAPTLSEALQKVADVYMVLLKTYKRERPAILQAIGGRVGREVTRAADLNEDEAGQVLKYLDAWIVKLKRNPKAGAPDLGFDQTYRNHGEEVGKRLDFVYQRLTSLSVQGQTLIDRMNETLVRMDRPEATTRYALDDDAAIQVCEIFEDWANDLAKDFTP